MSGSIRDEFHDQDAVEIPERARNAHAGTGELIQTHYFRFLPGAFLFLAAVTSLLADGASLAATAYLASLLVLRTLLEAALCHIAIDFRTALLGPGSHDVDCCLFA